MADERDDAPRETDIPNDALNSEPEFGRTDRYANRDEHAAGQLAEHGDVRVTMTGDGTDWDSGRTSSIARGSAVEDDVRSADAGTPGVPKRDSSGPEE